MNLKHKALPVVLAQQKAVEMKEIPERLVLFEHELSSVAGGKPMACGDGWTCSRGDGGSDFSKDD